MPRCFNHDPARDEYRPVLVKSNPNLTAAQVEEELTNLGEMERFLHPERFSPCAICAGVNADQWILANLEDQETAAAILELIEIDLEIAAELGGVDVS